PSGFVAETRYSAEAGLDVAFTRNAKGDLVRRLVDGNRVVRVEECNNSATTLEGVSCGTPDVTGYDYAPTGELWRINDPIAMANGPDANHSFIYQYDTLGRVISTQDPDAGTSTTVYDVAGNVQSTTDARGLQRIYGYDPLDRRLFIHTPDEVNDIE